MIPYLLYAGGSAGLAVVCSLVAYRCGWNNGADDRSVEEGSRLPLPRRVPGATIAELGEPGADQPAVEVVQVVLAGLKAAPVAGEGWPIGTRHAFYPPEIFSPTGKVYQRHRVIASHRAPAELVRTRLRVWLHGLVQRILAWPLEPAPMFAQWWLKAEHIHKHAVGEVPGATTQVARWNCDTGEHPAAGGDTEWDRAMAKLVADETAGAR